MSIVLRLRMLAFRIRYGTRDLITRYRLHAGQARANRTYKTQHVQLQGGTILFLPERKRTRREPFSLRLFALSALCGTLLAIPCTLGLCIWASSIRVV